MKWIIFCCLLFSSGSLMAQKPEQVKAAFLYQMAKFIDFNSTQINFCFYGENNQVGALLSKGKDLSINNAPIQVRIIKKSDENNELSALCNITYIDETLESDILRFWTDLNSKDTLTVGESINFLEKGGLASLVQEGKKVRLYLNKQQVMQQNFKVQSRLLSVSKFYPD